MIRSRRAANASRTCARRASPALYTRCSPAIMTVHRRTRYFRSARRETRARNSRAQCTIFTKSNLDPSERLVNSPGSHRKQTSARQGEMQMCKCPSLSLHSSIHERQRQQHTPGSEHEKKRGGKKKKKTNTRHDKKPRSKEQKKKKKKNKQRRQSATRRTHPGATIKQRQP